MKALYVSLSSRCDSAAMVPKTGELLPQPETPVKTVSRRLGSSTLISLRLFARARTTRISSWLSAARTASDSLSVALDRSFRPKLSGVIDTSNAALRGTVLGLLEQAARDEDGGLPPIVQLGHPALRASAVPFDGQLSSQELDLLINVMRRVMHAAPGVGLAAPQLGIPLQLAVIEDRFSSDPAIAEARSRTELPFFAILNPSYSPIGDRTASFFEGCLSFDGYQAVVERPYAVELKYSRPDGTAATQAFSGWPARIVQHETDHLGGTIYIDRAATRSLVSNSEYNRRWTQPTVDSAARELGF